MNPLEEYFHTALTRITYAGYGNEAEYVRNLKPPEEQTPLTFFDQYLWVILNEGKKEQVARQFYEAFWRQVHGEGTLEKFGFGKGSPFDNIPIRAKRAAAKDVFQRREKLFQEFLDAKDRIGFLDSLPFIGPVTKWHMARNLGIDCIKPDIHLTRIAEVWGFKTPYLLCKKIQDLTGERLGVIDVILWRYCNLTGDYGKWLKDRETQL